MEKKRKSTLAKARISTWTINIKGAYVSWKDQKVAVGQDRELGRVGVRFVKRSAKDHDWPWGARAAGQSSTPGGGADRR
jgi:hypothetical protein